MDKEDFKKKIQTKIKEIGSKDENIAEQIKLSKSSFSTRLSNPDSFSIDELKKLSDILEFQNVRDMIQNTTIFCSENTRTFLSNEDILKCENEFLKNENKNLGYQIFASQSFQNNGNVEFPESLEYKYYTKGLIHGIFSVIVLLVINKFIGLLA